MYHVSALHRAAFLSFPPSLHFTSPKIANVFPKITQICEWNPTTASTDNTLFFRWKFTEYSSVLFYRSLKAVNFYLPSDLEPGTGAPQWTKHQTAGNINQKNMHYSTLRTQTPPSAHLASAHFEMTSKCFFWGEKQKSEWWEICQTIKKIEL